MLKFVSNKTAGVQAYNFIKKRFQHWCFPSEIPTFLRAPI